MIHHGGPFPGHPLKELFRITNRRRTRNDLRIVVVHRAKPQQPPQNKCHMRPQNPSISVKLINRNHPQSLQELRPVCVRGQDARMEHVRVRQNHVG